MARVNILIPAYKANFLPRTLVSALRQTYADLAIIVSDDSPGAAATAPLRALAFPRDVRLVAGPRLGGMANVGALLARIDADCEFVHVLFDDDLVFPGFIQAHVDALEANPQSRVSVSSRWLVDGNDAVFGAYPLPEAMRRHPLKVVLVAPDFLFNTTVPTATNWLGEFSNAVWRRSYAQGLHARAAGGIRFSGLEDIGHMLDAGLQAPLVYLNEYLGAFRVHGEQNTGNTAARSIKAGHLAWGALAQMGYRAGQVSAAAADACLQVIAARVRGAFARDAEMMQFLALLDRPTPEHRLDGFGEAWEIFLRRPLEGTPPAPGAAPPAALHAAA